MRTGGRVHLWPKTQCHRPTGVCWEVFGSGCPRHAEAEDTPSQSQQIGMRASAEGLICTTQRQTVGDGEHEERQRERERERERDR